MRQFGRSVFNIIDEHYECCWHNIELLDLDLSEEEFKQMLDRHRLLGIDVEDYPELGCAIIYDELTAKVFGMYKEGEIEDALFSEQLNIERIYGLSKLNPFNITSMKHMFYSCEALSYIDFTDFDTSKVTDMHSTFLYCENLTEIDLSHFNTSQVTNMSAMFAFCRSLDTLDLSSFDTSKVKDMENMFLDCPALAKINLKNFKDKLKEFQR